ncbi:MAG: TAT-variant-translocated molybdopterin oxidoreductase [Bacteroidetes bacterium]|nr:TAT-variant-translocated molybdopterin oxidoreductase [Bacteroidota bacterium]
MSDTDRSKKTYWKSFGELGKDPAILEQLGNEFPPDYDQFGGDGSSITRRTFMGLMAASAALAATGCRRPEQEIVPYVRKPEYITPGISNHFATAFTLQNFATGLLVRSREGRPIKIEGNDQCPVSAGKSTHIAQASLLALYDPDRRLRPTVSNSDSTPLNAMRRMADAIREVSEEGKEVRIVVDEHASPSLVRLYDELERMLPNTRVITWPAIVAGGAAEANRQLFDTDAILIPDLSRADVILGIDADFLGTDPEALYHIRNFSSRRKPEPSSPDMNRFYAVEAAMTMTGSNADERIRLTPDAFDGFLLGLLHEIVVVRGHGTVDAGVRSALVPPADDVLPLIRRIAGDLITHSSVVMVGRHLSAHTHALGMILNHTLGAVADDGIIDPRRALPYSNAKTMAIEAFRREMEQGEVGAVIFADVNPAYSLPADSFRTLIANVQYRFSLSLYADETSKFCSIFIPVNHYLESWGDVRKIDGSEAVVQPLIAPLNEGQLSLGDVLIGITRAFDEGAFRDTPAFYDFVRNRWREEHLPASGRSSFDGFWHDILRSGHWAVEATGRQLILNNKAAAELSAQAAKHRVTVAATDTGTAVHFGVFPGYALYDGRYANLGWLMELPDPVTKVTWENVAALSRSTAMLLGVEQGDVITVTTGAGEASLPVLIQPGMADNTVITHTGFGRREGGRVAAGKGSNAYALMNGPETIGYQSATLNITGNKVRIATTQDHHSLSGDGHHGIDRSDIVKEGTLAAFLSNPASLYEKDLPLYGTEKNTDRPISITTPHDYSSGHRWGMTIDTSACVGCHACVTACQSENNIPVVGKEQVLRGREMHWIRIDRYYSGSEDNPDTLLQPMLCQHCEKAPCENVCPVAATTHSPEGLNEMTYNRCVGTRYCSNNCPYKVRRFNYLNYHKEDRDPLGMVFNPDVTVRMRGVMEKCTFCVQRINEAKHHAKNEGRELLQDGEVVTACQQACPADAIVFGNTNDPESAVSRSQTTERGYHVLRELNVVPSITYKARIRNTNGGEDA